VVTDPSGVWKSLNWINVPQIKKIVNHLPGLSVNFNRMFLVSTMERVRSDVGFASRRSMWVRLVIDVLISLRLHYLAGFLPASLQPIIDCTLTRSEH
jgi:hypothetical protein